MGLICPLEQRLCLEAMRGRKGHWASFVLRNKHSAWRSRGDEGLICPFEQGLRLEAVRDAGPVLSFGTRIAPAGNEGHGACFVLWSKHCAWRP